MQNKTFIVPKEVMDIIFNKLKDSRDIKNFSLVSKSFFYTSEYGKWDRLHTLTQSKARSLLMQLLTMHPRLFQRKSQTSYTYSLQRYFFREEPELEERTLAATALFILYNKNPTFPLTERIYNIEAKLAFLIHRLEKKNPSLTYWICIKLSKALRNFNAVSELLWEVNEDKHLTHQIPNIFDAGYPFFTKTEVILNNLTKIYLDILESDKLIHIAYTVAEYANFNYLIDGQLCQRIALQIYNNETKIDICYISSFLALYSIKNHLNTDQLKKLCNFWLFAAIQQRSNGAKLLHPYGTDDEAEIDSVFCHHLTKLQIQEVLDFAAGHLMIEYRSKQIDQDSFSKRRLHRKIMSCLSPEQFQAFFELLLQKLQSTHVSIHTCTSGLGNTLNHRQFDTIISSLPSYLVHDDCRIAQAAILCIQWVDVLSSEQAEILLPYLNVDNFKKNFFFSSHLYALRKILEPLSKDKVEDLKFILEQLFTTFYDDVFLEIQLEVLNDIWQKISPSTQNAILKNLANFVHNRIFFDYSRPMLSYIKHLLSILDDEQKAIISPIILDFLNRRFFGSETLVVNISCSFTTAIRFTWPLLTESQQNEAFDKLIKQDHPRLNSFVELWAILNASQKEVAFKQILDKKIYHYLTAKHATSLYHPDYRETLVNHFKQCITDNDKSPFQVRGSFDYLWHSFGHLLDDQSITAICSAYQNVRGDELDNAPLLLYLKSQELHFESPLGTSEAINSFLTMLTSTIEIKPLTQTITEKTQSSEEADIDFIMKFYRSIAQNDEELAALDKELEEIKHKRGLELPADEKIEANKKLKI